MKAGIGYWWIAILLVISGIMLYQMVVAGGAKEREPNEVLVYTHPNGFICEIPVRNPVIHREPDGGICVEYQDECGRTVHFTPPRSFSVAIRPR